MVNVPTCVTNSVAAHTTFFFLLRNMYYIDKSLSKVLQSTPNITKITLSSLDYRTTTIVARTNLSRDVVAAHIPESD